jgi:hypothetical protein
VDPSSGGAGGAATGAAGGAVTGLAVAGPVGAAVGGVVGAVGSLIAGQASAASSTYKAGVALLNKQISQQNAAWATESGAIQSQESGMKARQQIGQTKVVQAASGFDVNSGTGAKVRQDQSTVADYDQNVIRWDASKTSYGYETKAMTDQAESNLDIMAASTQTTAGEIGAATSFINAGSSVSSKWLQASQAGVFNASST